MTSLVEKVASVRWLAGGRTRPEHAIAAVRSIAASGEVLAEAAELTLRRLRLHGTQEHAHACLRVWAPVAASLGLSGLARELEDVAFKSIDRTGYDAVAAFVSRTRVDRERAVESAKAALEAELAHFALAAEVSGRAKHLYSIHEKRRAQGAEAFAVHDLFGLRIVVDSTADCYRALGVVHLSFAPLSDRFKDYIGRPKESRYQALHTVVRMGPRAEPVEVQIRSRAMHDAAERGSASHVVYKYGRAAAAGHADDRSVYPLTPAREVRRLPRGATPVDFAYAIHTDLGRRYAGAFVNGRYVSATVELRSGDVVEIVHEAGRAPSSLQLARVNTARARNRIRAALIERRAS